MDDQRFRTPRAVVSGLGSAHHGVHHFLVERVSALALVPLVLWGAFAAVGLVGAGHDAALEWIGQPINGVLTGALLISGLIHAKNAMQVVIEDYIHNEKLKLASVMANNFFVVAVALASIYAILKLSSGV